MGCHTVPHRLSNAYLFTASRALFVLQYIVNAARVFHCLSGSTCREGVRLSPHDPRFGRSCQIAKVPGSFHHDKIQIRPRKSIRPDIWRSPHELHTRQDERALLPSTHRFQSAWPSQDREAVERPSHQRLWLDRTRRRTKSVLAEE